VLAYVVASWQVAVSEAAWPTGPGLAGFGAPVGQPVIAGMFRNLRRTRAVTTPTDRCTQMRPPAGPKGSCQAVISPSPFNPSLPTAHARRLQKSTSLTPLACAPTGCGAHRDGRSAHRCLASWTKPHMCRIGARDPRGGMLCLTGRHRLWPRMQRASPRPIWAPPRRGLAVLVAAHGGHSCHGEPGWLGPVAVIGNVRPGRGRRSAGR
jgi:hypothetical protein